VLGTLPEVQIMTPPKGMVHRDELAALMTPAYAVRLTDALDYSGTPTIRVHDGTQVLAGL